MELYTSYVFLLKAEVILYYLKLSINLAST